MSGKHATTRRDWQPKPCGKCGGEKPAGRGVKLCNTCAYAPFTAYTLDEVIADQEKEMRMGSRVHRQRFGDTSRARQRTLSLDALDPDWWIDAAR